MGLTTGTASFGNTGLIRLQTGEATTGKGGDIQLTVGKGHGPDGANGAPPVEAS